MADETPEVAPAGPAVFSPDDPAPEVVVDTPAEVVAEATPDAPEEPKEPKSPIKQLTGRVGYLTKTLHQKDAALEEANRQLEALKAMLPAGTEAPATSTPQAPDVEARAQQIANERAFDAECNKVFEQGSAKFKDDFKESVESLNAAGLARRDVIEAALATDAAPDVLHFLGQDLDEAARIAALSPVKMAVELTKLAGKLTVNGKTTKAPPPIPALSGSAKPTVDIYDPDIGMDEYAARRQKEGAWWARPASQTH